MMRGRFGGEHSSLKASEEAHLNSCFRGNLFSYLVVNGPYDDGATAVLPSCRIESFVRA